MSLHLHRLLAPVLLVALSGLTACGSKGVDLDQTRPYEYNRTFPDHVGRDDGLPERRTAPATQPSSAAPATDSTPAEPPAPVNTTATATATATAATAPAVQPAPAPYTALQARPDRVVARLPNRMILVAQALPTAPVVSAQVWVKTGSLYEQEHVGAGLSHFLEHLLSGGTTATRPEAESTRLLGQIGAATNAATSLDTVRYYINTTADNAPQAIELLTDWMRNSIITDAEYQRERDVIQREFSMGQGDPGRIHWKLTQQARYAATPTHPAASPTIGYLDEFLDISRDEIYDFYKRMYVPNNMLFVVVGDIDPAATIEQLATLWDDAETGELPELAFPVEPEAAEPVEVTGVAAIKRPRVRLLWPGVKLASENDYALDLLASILGQGESSRLVRDLRDQQRLVSSIDAFNYSTAWGRGFFGVDYELAEDAARDGVRAAVAEHIARLQHEPVTYAELDRAKRQVLSRVVRSGQTAEGVASMLAGDILTVADPDYRARYADAVQSLIAEDLQEAARAVLDPDRFSVVALDPAGEDDELVYPTRPPAVTLNDKTPTEPVDLDNHTLLTRLTRTLDGEDASDGRTVTADAPEVRTLDNGLRVVVQRTTVVPAVSVQFYALGGLLAEEPGREGVAYAANAMLPRGTATRSAQDIAATLEDLGATLGSSAGNNTAYVTGSALEEDFPTLMNVIADVIKHPAFAESEWESMKPRLLAAIDRETDSWSGELRTRFRERYFGEHPWSQTPTGRRDVVADLTVSDLSEFYQSRLAAEGAVLAVVGDVEPEAAFAAAAERFGDLPAEPAVAFDPVQQDEPAPGLTVLDTDKPVAAVQIGFGPGITRDDPDYAAVQVISRVLGDFPAGWLQQELRGKGPGLVYASSAGAFVGLQPGYFALLFNTQPDTVVEATRRALSVVDRIKSEPVSADDLARAKAKVLTTEFFGRQSTGDLAAGQALDLLYGIDDLTGESFLREVDALTAADLMDVAQRRLNDPVAVVISHETVDEAALREMLP